MKEIIKYIDENKDRIVKFTQELVRIPSVNPPGENYEKIAGLLDKKCSEIGLKTERIITPKAMLKQIGVSGGSRRINLLARWDAGAKKTLHFNGHYDVVPVTSGWSVAPFGGVVKNGKLYGRGAEDMKATIAAMIYAVQALKSMGITPGVNVELSFTPDEEIGGQGGLGYLVKKGIVRPDYAVSEGLFGDYVSLGNKGLLWMEFEVIGRSSHASTPYKGINSFQGMTGLAQMLLELEDGLSKRKTEFATRDIRDRLATMVMGGVLSGGTKVNTVPDRSSFSMDRRLLPEEDIDKVRREILAVVRKFQRRNPMFKVRVRTLAAEPPVITDVDSQLCRAMSGCVRKIRKTRPKLAITPGATDLRFLIRKGIPAVGYNAVGLDRCHADDEFVYVKSILDTAKIYALLMVNLK